MEKQMWFLLRFAVVSASVFVLAVEPGCEQGSDNGTEIPNSGEQPMLIRHLLCEKYHGLLTFKAADYIAESGWVRPSQSSKSQQGWIEPKRLRELGKSGMKWLRAQNESDYQRLIADYPAYCGYQGPVDKPVLIRHLRSGPSVLFYKAADYIAESGGPPWREPPPRSLEERKASVQILVNWLESQERPHFERLVADYHGYFGHPPLGEYLLVASLLSNNRNSLTWAVAFINGYGGPFAEKMPKTKDTSLGEMKRVAQVYLIWLKKQEKAVYENLNIDYVVYAATRSPIYSPSGSAAE